MMAPQDLVRDRIPDGTKHFSAVIKIIKEKKEKRLIENALRQTEGNKAKAARSLGIERSVLYYKMKKLGMT